MNSQKIKLALVDDNVFMLKSIKEKLSLFDELFVKTTQLGGSKILEHLEEHSNYHLILMDIEMPGLNGVETTTLVKKKYPHIKVIMLTVFDNDENIFNAIKAGADGYLLKDVNPDVLHKGILDTLNGGAAMNPSIAMKTLKLLRNPDTISKDQNTEIVTLTARETDVLEQLGQGLSYTKIADNLIISPSTVRKHIENIYKKLQVHNKLEAVDMARKQNLI
ncbi:response regulator [Psychroflexus planctonicus]|uniref:DNA-binding response regulator n=1 Tax=Psychroflexus planctonicus TaxID=1526575 RepID=A0ABQ1SE37_9FLAO|nr:response regulator transcription factor [Psychroflexus planctonicus]GGE31725.1 DNA-binding response regulator [Psychroflexus planctonicus]